MNRLLRKAVLAVVAGICADAALAGEAALPEALRAALPSREAAVAAIDGDTLVLRASAERAAAAARAQGYERGPHDWVGGAGYASRDVAQDQRYDEWELSVQRGIRLPAKADADRRLARMEQEAATFAFADARHAAAVALLEAWIAWRGAMDQERITREAAAMAVEDLRIVELRVRNGDAAAADLDAAQAAQAQAASSTRMAALAVEEARITLDVRFPGLALPASPAALPEPAAPTVALPAWAERVVEHNHEIELAQARADLAALQAQRARLDRRGDPVVGIRALSERGGDEQAVGVFVNVPLGSGARRFAAAEQADLANAAATVAVQVRREVQRDAQVLLARAQGSLAAWQSAAAATRAAASHRERLQRGLALGGVRVSELLEARRRLLEAERAELAARATALTAIARLLLDAHAYWIDDGDHAEEP